MFQVHVEVWNILLNVFFRSSFYVLRFWSRWIERNYERIQKNYRGESHFWDRDIKIVNFKIINRNKIEIILKLFLENIENTHLVHFWCAKNTYRTKCKIHSAQFLIQSILHPGFIGFRENFQSPRNAHLSGRLHNYPNVCPACNGPWHLWVSAKKIWSLDPSPLEIRNRLINLTLPENRSE